MKHLRSEFYLLVKEHGFYDACELFMKKLNALGYTGVTRSDLGKFLHGGKKTAKTPKVVEVPAVEQMMLCHSLNVCMYGESMCADNKCKANK